MGSGLGGLSEKVDSKAELSCAKIPHFPRSPVETHSGSLRLGTLEGTPVVAMQGRLHGYEGHSLQEVTFPVRVLRLLGAEVLILTGICGGMNPLWTPGELVLLDDHINLLGDNPLVGENLDELGPRFPDMSRPYDRELQEIAQRVAMAERIRLNRGVYVAVVLSTLLFVITHPVGHNLPLTQIIGGIVFAVAYEKEKSLLVPITSAFE